MIKLLLRVGLVKRRDGKIVWPFHAPPSHVFTSWKMFRGHCTFWGPFYLLRNPPECLKWLPGRLLPRRWGFGVFGFEFGDRGG